MNDKALEALHVAAQAIKEMEGTSNVTVDNDHNGGELFFDVGQETFRMKVEEAD